MTTIEQTSALRGRAIGTLVMTGFGVWWVFAAMSSINGLSSWTYVAVAIIPAALTGFAIFRLCRLPNLPGNSSLNAEKMGRNFRIVLIAEVLLIVLAIVLLGRSGHPDLITASIALIVGLHFLPLAAIFRVPLYYTTGIVMTAWTVICLIFFQSLPRTINVAIGCGVVLWLTSLILLLERERQHRRRNSEIPF
jgi:hypothetical protein